MGDAKIPATWTETSPIENVSPTADRYDHMAIHPYPSHLITTWVVPDGTKVTIRPIRPEDADLEVEFMEALSPETRYFRFMNTIRELPPAMITRLTQIDYFREMAFIATLDIDDPDECLRLFKSNTVVGWLIFLGLLAGGLWMAFQPPS